jgi:hypothetical protein
LQCTFAIFVVLMKKSFWVQTRLDMFGAPALGVLQALKKADEGLLWSSKRPSAKL